MIAHLTRYDRADCDMWCRVSPSDYEHRRAWDGHAPLIGELPFDSGAESSYARDDELWIEQDNPDVDQYELFEDSDPRVPEYLWPEFMKYDLTGGKEP